MQKTLLLKLSRDFPGGPVVKNPPSNAGDTGSIPGQGTKIPHAVGQLSPCATTTELMRLNERACVLQITEPMRPGAHAPQLERSPWATTGEKSMRHNWREVHAPQLERSPCATTREKPAHHNKRSRMPQLRPNAAKKKKKRKLIN